MSLRRFSAIAVVAALLASLTGCYYSHPNRVDHWRQGAEGRVDSVSFYISHHYWVGYNFVTSDTLPLQASSPKPGEDYSNAGLPPVTLQKGDRVVVADISCVPADSVDSLWVKVARDQFSQGWVRESVLLERVTPDDPISQFIDTFSSRRSLLFWTVIGAAALFALSQAIRRRSLRIVHFHDVPNFYPTLLCLCVSGSATVYGSIQRFVPATWVEFYFRPTLNPFNQDIPLILALFILSVWMTILVAIAAVDEVRHQLPFGEAVSYLASLCGVCFVLYLVFTLTTPIYIGYPLLPAYWAFAVWKYLSHRPTHLYCGICGRPIQHRGRCPHCGAENT